MKLAILRCALLYPLALTARVLAYPLVPVAVYFANEAGRLPGLFWWLETSDHLGWEGPQVVEPTRNKTARYGRKIGLMFWLWRNRAYALQFRMGIPKDRAWNITALRGTATPPSWGFSWFYGAVTTPHDGREYFEFQPRLSVAGFVLYIRIGWKIAGNPPGGKGGSGGMYTGFTPRTKTAKHWG